MIHDTILGSNLFLPHEIAVLDLPLLQRLRRVNQVDVVSLVFPSGNHNRFEHTLGVTVIAGKMVSAIYKKLDEDDVKKIGFDQSYVLRHARMAAILHDCGHGPFSHISEEIFKYCEDYIEEKKNNPILAGASPHEALSYLIVTSGSFKQFFRENVEIKYGVEIDLDFVGEMIVGYTGDNDATKDSERAKRALVISSKTVGKNIQNLQKIMGLVDRPDKLLLVRKAISEGTADFGRLVPWTEIWVDIPKTPKFKEGAEWPIKSIGAKDNCQRLRDVFPVEDWTRAFSQNKWQGYVFSKPDTQLVVHLAAKNVFEAVFDIEFNDYAKSLCKIG